MSVSARWILGATLGASLGHVVASVAGAGLTRVLGAPEGTPGVVAHGVAMVLTGSLEGAVFGLVTHGAALSRLAADRRGRWVGAHALAFAVAWAAGTLASGLEPSHPTVGAVLLFAAAAGASLGGAVGLAQAWSLGRRIDRGTWILGGAAGWAGGMVAGALVSELVPGGPLTLTVLGVELVSGAASGAVFGAVSEPYVARLSQNR